MGTYRMCVCFTRRFKTTEAEPPADVKGAFKKYAEGGTHMTAEQLLRFLVEVQGKSGALISDAERTVELVLQKRHHIAKYTRKRTLTLDDFHHYLFSAELNPPIGDKVLFMFALVTWGSLLIFEGEGNGFWGSVWLLRKCGKRKGKLVILLRIRLV
jgi:hypothetical protein